MKSQTLVCSLLCSAGLAIGYLSNELVRLSSLTDGATYISKIRSDVQIDGRQLSIPVYRSFPSSYVVQANPYVYVIDSYHKTLTIMANPPRNSFDGHPVYLSRDDQSLMIPGFIPLENYDPKLHFVAPSTVEFTLVSGETLRLTILERIESN